MKIDNLLIKQQLSNISQHPTSHRNTSTAIANTGALSHYICPQDPHRKTGTATTPIHVALPSEKIVQSMNEKCELLFNNLPAEAKEAHVIPSITHSSLVSIGKLCDASCIATFDKEKVEVQLHNKTVLKGQRDTTTGLWRFPLSTQETCHNAYQKHKHADLVTYLHAAAGSPAKSIWINAIKQGFFHSWPGLTVELVNKHLPDTTATAKGHLDQTRKNTKQEPQKELETESQTTNQLMNTLHA